MQLQKLWPYASSHHKIFRRFKLNDMRLRLPRAIVSLMHKVREDEGTSVVELRWLEDWPYRGCTTNSLSILTNHTQSSLGIWRAIAGSGLIGNFTIKSLVKSHTRLEVGWITWLESHIQAGCQIQGTRCQQNKGTSQMGTHPTTVTNALTMTMTNALTMTMR